MGENRSKRLTVMSVCEREVLEREGGVYDVPAAAISLFKDTVSFTHTHTHANIHRLRSTSQGN